jgi:signal recognition particle receptor subunit beta
VIFVIDANDSERLGEARDELQRILVEDALQGAPLLVYANKQDRPYVVSLSDITEALGLHRTLGREWHVKVRMRASVAKGAQSTDVV